MLHDQCRGDRDDYIHYKYHNLAGYEEALNKTVVKGVPREAAAEALCEKCNWQRVLLRVEIWLL
jgi:hypothetical protein